MSHRLTASGQLERISNCKQLSEIESSRFLLERLFTKISGTTKIVGKTTVYLLSHTAERWDGHLGKFWGAAL